MKTFLVATDFSLASERAAEYAIRLAQPMEAGLVLCHVYSAPNVAEPQVLNLSTAIADSYDILHANQEELRHLADKLTGDQQRLSSREVSVDTVTLQGEVVKEVTTLAKSRDASLVVVGAHEEDVLNIFFGNHTLALLEHSRLPVLVVPAEARFRKIRTILFACHWQEMDSKHLQWLCQFASYWDASVLVVHVATDQTEVVEKTERMNQFIQGLPGEMVAGKLSFRLIHADSVVEELDHLIDTETIDLLAMTTKKRNLFQQITHWSMTKWQANEIEIPLLVFQANRLADIWIL